MKYLSPVTAAKSDMRQELWSSNSERAVLCLYVHMLLIPSTRKLIIFDLDIACSRIFLTNSCFPIVASSKLKAALMHAVSFLSLLSNSLSSVDADSHKWPERKITALDTFSGALSIFSCAAERRYYRSLSESPLSLSVIERALIFCLFFSLPSAAAWLIKIRDTLRRIHRFDLLRQFRRRVYRESVNPELEFT